MIETLKNTLVATARFARTGGKFFLEITDFSRLIWHTVTRTHLITRNIRITLEQMYAIGVESLPLVSVIGLFIGAQTVIQAVYQFSGIVPYRYLGVAFCKGMITEIGPVMTSMVVSGRIATAIAAEIGSMKGNEQLDAMAVLCLDPIRYLIVPKTIACMIMLPILVIYAETLAFFSSIVTVIFSVDVTLHVYLEGLRLFFNAPDLLIGVFKTTVFGAILAITGSHYGLQATGGAEGVGNATTKSVMTSLVLILIFDFLIAFMLL
jgi:phospholipid/cholesterol/gamma-HCH transport system permease protein